MKPAPRWKWRVARALDRSRRFCWADLVGWVLGDTPFRETWTRTPECADPPRQPFGDCYCAKFRASGQDSG